MALRYSQKHKVDRLPFYCPCFTRTKLGVVSKSVTLFRTQSILTQSSLVCDALYALHNYSEVCSIQSSFPECRCYHRLYYSRDIPLSVLCYCVLVWNFSLLAIHMMYSILIVVRGALLSLLSLAKKMSLCKCFVFCVWLFILCC